MSIEESRDLQDLAVYTLKLAGVPEDTPDAILNNVITYVATKIPDANADDVATRIIASADFRLSIVKFVTEANTQLKGEL